MNLIRQARHEGITPSPCKFDFRMFFSSVPPSSCFCPLYLAGSPCLKSPSFCFSFHCSCAVRALSTRGCYRRHFLCLNPSFRSTWSPFYDLRSLFPGHNCSIALFQSFSLSRYPPPHSARGRASPGAPPFRRPSFPPCPSLVIPPF